MQILFSEVASLYRAISSGEEAGLQKLPIQYADYAVWQRSWLSGEMLEREIAYWREQLAGAPSFLELPTDRPRPAVRSSRGGLRVLHLPESSSKKIGALSRQSGATIFMTLLAAFQALLARYSSQAD